jgi:hypothetical protein
MDEKDPKGKLTGSFSGRLIDDKRFVGTWSNPKKTKFMHCIVVSPTVANALDNGKDGVIVTQQTKKIAKPEGHQPEGTAIITYPIVAQKFLPKDIGPKVQKVLSTKNVLDESPEEMIANIKGGDLWLNEVDYNVNYNKNYLVDVDFTRNGCGAYPDGSTCHALVDLKTGNQILAKNAFVKSAIPKLREMIQSRMIKTAKTTLQEVSNNPEDLTSVKGQLPSPITVPQQTLDNFSVSDDGLTFTHDWGFPHVCEALEPDGNYFFPFSELKTIIDKDGPLGQFISRCVISPTKYFPSAAFHFCHRIWGLNGDVVADPRASKLSVRRLLSFLMLRIGTAAIWS